MEHTVRSLHDAKAIAHDPEARHLRELPVALGMPEGVASEP